MKLSEFIDINPRTSLPKGTEAEFVPMEALNPQRRYVATYPKKKYSGGAKFINGDTLFARITPCLENGKISQFISNSNLPAFGSTEYWVLRAKEGVSDPSYVYYLAKSELLRRPAEKSMVGASGRQRAQIESIQDVDIGDVSLDEQKKIAGALSAYDDLIENNTKRIEILEAMARLLYGHYLNQYSDMLINSTLGECITELESGKRPRGGVGSLSEGIPSIGAENINGVGKHDFGKDKFIAPDFFNAMRKGKIQNGDIAIYKDGAYIGRSSYFLNNFPHSVASVNEHVFLLRPDRTLLGSGQLYLIVQSPEIVGAIRATNSNSAQPGINQVGLSGVNIKVLPKNVGVEFEDKVNPIFTLITSLAKKNYRLAEARDLLLPRLLSGEIEL